MPVAELCRRDVAVAFPETRVQAAAALLRDRGEGALVVLEAEHSRRPVGLVTCEDLALEVALYGLDPAHARLGELTGRPMGTVRDDEGLFEAVRRMRLQRHARLTVVDTGGALLGLLCLEDILGLFAQEIAALATVVARQHPAAGLLQPA